jgi:hypothetical protein
MSRWLLALDNKGEVYTRSRTNEQLIEEVLNSFDGVARFYCCLSDPDDESCLWCVGEPDRRLVEGRLLEDDTIFHFVLRRRSSEDDSPAKVKHGMELKDTVNVAYSEILTAAEAVAVFKAFYRNKRIPEDFTQIAKACLFGSLSFKD